MSASKKKPLSSFPAEAESPREAVLIAILGYAAPPVNACKAQPLTAAVGALSTCTSADAGVRQSVITLGRTLTVQSGPLRQMASRLSTPPHGHQEIRSLLFPLGLVR